MPVERFWQGRNLRILLTGTPAQVRAAFPDHKWDSLKSKRKHYRRKLRTGEIELPPDDQAPQEEKILRLRDRLRQTQVQLDDAREKTLEYVAALRSAVFEAAEDIKLDPPKAHRTEPKGKGREEIAVLDVSDLQLGKETPTYNIDVCAQRMRTLAADVIQISTIQNAHHPVRKLHIHLLGDIVEGEGIFPNQAHQIHAGLYRQIIEGQRILTNLILDLLTYFETIHVTAVIGNHGALKMKGEVDPETNMDRLVYAVTRQSFADEKRVTWNIPEGKGQRNWYAVNKIYKWGFLLAHGDQIRGWGGIPFYGALKKSLGWIDAIDTDAWDYLHVGHHHTPTMLTFNNRTVLFNGTTESSNEFAQELLAATGRPCQWLGFVHPNRGVTSQYWIDLELRESQMDKYKRIARVGAPLP